VIPAVALLRPQQMVGENEMSTDPAHRRRNVAAVRAMAAMIVMIFVFSTLMALYQDGDAPGWAVLLSLLVLVGLGVAVFLLQRVDHAARERSGTSARVENPADPRPSRSLPGRDDDGR
jgi:Na+/melibiose symporter-like transporter